MGHPYVQRMAVIEVPVSILERSIDWYQRILGVNVAWRGEHEATLELQHPGSPSLFLVETAEVQPLSFHNSRGGFENDIVDFYTPDLVGFHQFLQQNDVTVSRPSVGPRGGFGFKDPDSNYFGAFNNDPQE